VLIVAALGCFALAFANDARLLGQAIMPVLGILFLQAAVSSSLSCFNWTAQPRIQAPYLRLALHCFYCVKSPSL